MAETDTVASDVLSDASVGADVINETVISINGTKIPSTPEGIAIAYGSLVFMAILPIFVGSFRSLKKEVPEETLDEVPEDGIIGGLFVGSRPAGEPVESMSSKDAALFPLIASATLFGLYVFFKIFSKEYINYLLSAYFFVLGVFALAHIVGPPIAKMLPRNFPNAHYNLLFMKRADDGEVETTNGANDEQAPSLRPLPEEILNYEFDRKDLVSLLFCALIGSWYFLKKHWIANNLFGLAFAINGVEFLQLPRVSTGFILLGGLFFYDIFWVFGTDVMVTVAKSFEAPIKLVFPQDLLEKGPIEASDFAMLGLGDIVIPGIFIALLLRFDKSRHQCGSKPYFYAGFLAYFLGLLLTIFVMHVYKHAQPALLYLVPACLGAPLILSLLKGETTLLFNYEDDAELVDEEDNDNDDDDDAAAKKDD